MIHAAAPDGRPGGGPVTDLYADKKPPFSFSHTKQRGDRKFFPKTSRKRVDAAGINNMSICFFHYPDTTLISYNLGQNFPVTNNLPPS